MTITARLTTTVQRFISVIMTPPMFTPEYSEKGTGKGFLIGSPFPACYPIKDHLGSQGYHYGPKDSRVVSGPEETDLQQGAQNKGENQGERSRGPETHSVTGYHGVGHKRSDHGHLTLSEIRHFRRLVNNDHRQSY